MRINIRSKNFPGRGEDLDLDEPVSAGNGWQKYNVYASRMSSPQTDGLVPPNTDPYHRGCFLQIKQGEKRTKQF